MQFIRLRGRGAPRKRHYLSPACAMYLSGASLPLLLLLSLLLPLPHPCQGLQLKKIEPGVGALFRSGAHSGTHLRRRITKRHPCFIANSMCLLLHRFCPCHHLCADNNGIETDCAFGAVNGWVPASDLGFCGALGSVFAEARPLAIYPEFTYHLINFQAAAWRTRGVFMIIRLLQQKHWHSPLTWWTT